MVFDECIQAERMKFISLVQPASLKYLWTFPYFTVKVGKK